MKSKHTPTSQARAYGIRNYRVYWFTAMTKITRNQLIRAYVAGHRAGRNGK